MDLTSAAEIMTFFETMEHGRDSPDSAKITTPDGTFRARVFKGFNPNTTTPVDMFLHLVEREPFFCVVGAIQEDDGTISLRVYTEFEVYKTMLKAKHNPPSPLHQEEN